VKKGADVDKEEAERVAAAIGREAWLKVLRVELNPVTNEYEVRCRDLGMHLLIFVRSPREWIMLKRDYQ